MSEMIKTAVLIETARHQILGNVTVPAGERLSDYVNDRERDFFSVTEAQMAPLEDRDRMRDVDFILVNRSEISIIRPGWDVQPAIDPLAEARDSFGMH